MLSHLDLFSGIGGFAIALKSVACTKLFCEIDEDAIQVLQYHISRGMFPSAHIEVDVRALTQGGKYDVMTAGWPCTGFSVCGNRKGFKNVDSALFSHVLRVTRLSSPQVVIMENTPAVKGEEAYIAKRFRGLGYRLHTGIFTAEEVGLPHRRARWFAIAYKAGSERSLTALSEIILPQIRAEPPITTMSAQADRGRRFRLLRNAVVPRTAAFAIASLCRTALGEPVLAAPSSCIDLKLEIRQGSLRLRKRCWPTLHGHWMTGAATLTKRCAGDIQTAVRHAAHVPKGEVNLIWLEWLMNFPTGWTR